MENKKPKLPDEGLGKFLVIVGCALLLAAFFAPRQRGSAAFGGLMALSWGLSQVTGAKKWRQKYGEPSAEELLEIKKSHSVSNLPLLLMWLAFSIAVLLFAAFAFVMLFHHER